MAEGSKSQILIDEVLETKDSECLEGKKNRCEEASDPSFSS
jgi:hypothetical protein